jgi:CheY-like chemotaxis protein
MPDAIEPKSIVLVMDCNDTAARVMISTLKRGGFDVVACTEPGEAFELCQKETSGIDLAIVDPGTPGLRLSEFLAGINPRIRVLLVGDPDVLENPGDWIFARNIRLSLPKPIRRSTLLGSVLEVAGEPLYRTA